MGGNEQSTHKYVSELLGKGTIDKKSSGETKGRQGSNSKFLSSDIVTEFRGRGDEIRIYPLSFAEFYAAFDGDYDDAWETFLISKADRYDIKGRKYVGANLKYYFTDVGLRNARLNFRQQEPTHIMENIVYNELLIRGYNVDVGIVEVYAKNDEGKTTRKQFEVDFVVNQGSQRYYIQVAYDMTSEEKQKQEFNSFRNIPDSFKKIVVVNGTKKPWRNEEGFVIMGMKYFLLNADSLEF